MLFYLWIILFYLQGCLCSLYIANGEINACIYNFTSNSWLNNCITKHHSDVELIFEFDYNTGSVYYFYDADFSKSIGGIFCGRFAPDPTCKDISDIENTPHYANVLDMTFDWVHHTMYLIHCFGERLIAEEKWPRPEFPNYFTELKDSYISPNDIAETAHVEGNKFYFIDLQVDPYNRSLFIHLCNNIPSKELYWTDKSKKYCVVLRTDLKARGTRQTTRRRHPYDMKLYVDVTELHFYVCENTVLHKYDYDGKELQKISLGFGSFVPPNFVIFRNIMHFSYYNRGDEIYIIVEWNITQSIDTITAKRLDAGDRNIILFDARTKRQLKNGNYLCDRKDCQDSCEVLPTGDTCSCTKFRVKYRNETKCYECGQSKLTNMLNEPTIIDGVDASHREFPWHSIIYELRGDQWEQICGGTLITNSVVLTAAHCVVNMDVTNKLDKKVITSLMVALGKIYCDWSIKEDTEEKFKVKEIRSHHDFISGSTTFAQDIALLLLDGKANNSRFIMPACLNFNQDPLPDYNTLKAYIPGFGKTVDYTASSSEANSLKYATVKRFLPYTECITEAKTNDNRSIYFTLTADKFCIGDGKVSQVQQGDSGGGLTIVHKGLHYVVGVVSSKFLKIDGDSYTYNYGAFSNVSLHMDWVIQNLPAEE